MKSKPGNTRAADEAAPADVLSLEPAAGGEATPSGQQQYSKVVYIGHLPHGFYESEMLGFFSQFGKLTRVRMSRNKHTGHSKHYAFLEFQHAEVAEIAAGAMDGYFLMKQRLTCRVLRVDEVHPALFKGANRKFKNVPWRRLESQRHNRQRTPKEHATRVAKLIARDRKRQQRILAAGMDYEYPSLASLQPPKPTRTVF